MWWTASVNFMCKIYSPESLAGGGGGGGGWFAKRCHSLSDHRINCKLKIKIANTILLIVTLTRFAYLLLEVFGKLRRIYMVKGGYKREPEPVASPQSTTLHSTGNTSVKKEVGHSNTRRTVRLCSFPLKLLLHIVYIFNILCGLKVINSRHLQ